MIKEIILNNNNNNDNANNNNDDDNLLFIRKLTIKSYLQRPVKGRKIKEKPRNMETSLISFLYSSYSLSYFHYEALRVILLYVCSCDHETPKYLQLWQGAVPRIL